MKKSARTRLNLGISMMTATAIAFVLSVAAPTRHPIAAPTPTARVMSLPVQLTAAVEPTLTTAAVPTLLTDWLQRIVVPPSASAPVPTPQFEPVIAATSIDSTIKNAYNAVEPWVRYGFEVAAYAVGWIPYVGWLAPQVIIFYNLGERIVRSITFNVADWLGGHISFGQGLSNVGRDTVNSFIYFANDQLAFWLPPLPPIPPLPGGSIVGPLAANVVPEAVKGKSADPLTGKGGDVVAALATEVPPAEVRAPEPTATNGRPGLPTFTGTTSGIGVRDGVQTLGGEPDATDAQAAPKANGIANRLNSVVQNLVSLVPSPQRGPAQTASSVTGGLPKGLASAPTT